MKPGKLTMNRPRFQPGFEPDHHEAEEMPHPRKWNIEIPYLYVALSAVVSFFLILVCYVFLILG